MISSDWKLKYDNFQLTVNEIHVWLLDIKKISKSENDFNKILSDDELDRKNKFHFEKDRIVFGTTRGLLKILLAKYLKCSTNDVMFIYNEFGKPSLSENHTSTIRFNVSHSKDFGLLAFNLNNNIGVDIEYINEELVTEDIARNYFSEYEISELFKLNELDRIGAFFNIWTRKEAFIKAIGKGLSIPLNSFDVSVKLDEPKIKRFGDNKIQSMLNLYNLPYIENYKSAMVHLAKPKKIKNFFVSNSKYLIK